MTLKSTWKRIVVGASTVMATVALAACSAQPGVALKIDGTTYTEDEVSEAAQQLSQISGQQFPTAGVVYVLAQGAAVREVADQHGVEFSDEDARNALASVQSPGEPVNEAAVGVVRINQLLVLLQGDLDQQALAQEVTEAQKNKDVELNPRYGELDENNAVYAPNLQGVVLPPQQ
ncbi:hypothetical protein [Actinomyces urinae]|uniref:hypothetical protein n=1 Tax=Actinomyces urinae TaxID=1689268 RepID=UPI000A99052D|nr:hypothetical protein [Actinomyces urinae]